MWVHVFIVCKCLLVCLLLCVCVHAYAYTCVCMHVCTCMCVSVCMQTESQNKIKIITKHNQVSNNERVKQKWSSGGSESFLQAVLLPWRTEFIKLFPGRRTAVKTHFLVAFLFHLEENEMKWIFMKVTTLRPKNTKRGKGKHEVIESYPSPISIAAEPAHVLYRNCGWQW